jgi:hypothetical protein
MAKNTPEILLLVEGKRKEPQLMKKLFKIYGIDSLYQIIPYETNIYGLYRSMLEELGSDSDSWDIQTHLKSRETDTEKKSLLSRKFTEILLIFDFEPHDNLFAEAKIREMVGFFADSTQMGKLYINYPMVESFYHMKSIPDPDYNAYTTPLAEPTGYKARVGKGNRSIGQGSFISEKSNTDIVIRQNIEKAWHILEADATAIIPSATDILESQLTKIKNEKLIAVLCTCVFYIVDYNPRLIGGY